VSEPLYRIGPFSGVALPEPLEDFAPGHLETDRLADVIELPRRRSLFGFARAVTEAPSVPDAAPANRFRTVICFRRLLPGEDVGAAPAPVAPRESIFPAVDLPALALREDALPELSFPAVTVPELSLEPLTQDAEPAALEEESTPSMPSNIESSAVESDEPAGEPAVEHVDEPEIIVEPEIVIPDPAAQPATVAAVEPEPEPVAKRAGKKVKAPKAKQRRGGGSKTQKQVGLKIGASQIAAALVSNDGSPEVLQLARTPFPAGVVVEGEVRDTDALALALKSFFADSKLPTRDVRLGLSSNRIGVRTMDIGGVDDEERFANAVRFKAHEVLPIAMNESVLDYRVLGEHTNDAGETVRRVLLVVAPRDQIEPYVAAATAAGIRLSGIDLEAFALLRAFVEPRSAGSAAEQAALVVVSIGHESSTLVVSGAGVCEFTRVFGWGGASLDSAIASACSLDLLEAAALKHELSLTGAVPESVGPALAGRALEAVRTELTLFARELVSSLQFYQKQPDSLGIGEVVVSGGTSQLDGLADSLNTLVGVPVRLGDPLARARVASRVTDPAITENLGSLAIAIGLGIEDDPVRSVNLLPSDVRNSAQRRVSLTQALVPAGVLIPVAAVAAMFLPAKSGVSDRQSTLEGLQAELATLPQPQSPGIDQGIKGQQARRAAVVADVLSRRTAWDRVLREFSLVLPSDVWLTELDATVPTPLGGLPATAATAAPVAPGAIQVAPTGFTIKGRTFTQAAVARLLSRLSTVPTFARVTLVSSGVGKVGSRNVVEFQIAADVRGAGEAS
jgi:type IV pilus assembly protein PilM